MQQSTTLESRLETFLKEKFKNHLIVLTSDNYESVKRPFLVMYHHFNEKCDKLGPWVEMLYKISKQYNLETVQFCVADFESLELFHARWEDLDYFGFDADMPPYVYAVDSFEHQFQYEGHISCSDLSKYTKDLVDCKLWRTETIRQEDDCSKTSRKICASNFKELVIDNDKDVVVTFHNDIPFDWFPFLDDAPYELKDDAHKLVFYNYNAKENYIPLELKVQGYPTSILFPSNNKEKRFLFAHNDFFNSFWYKNVCFRSFLAANVTTELTNLDRKGHFKNSDDINK